MKQYIKITNLLKRLIFIIPHLYHQKLLLFQLLLDMCSESSFQIVLTDICSYIQQDKDITQYKLTLVHSYS